MSPPEVYRSIRQTTNHVCVGRCQNAAATVIINRVAHERARAGRGGQGGGETAEGAFVNARECSVFTTLQTSQKRMFLGILSQKMPRFLLANILHPSFDKTSDTSKHFKLKQNSHLPWCIWWCTLHVYPISPLVTRVGILTTRFYGC